MELDTKTDIEFVAFASEGGLTIPKSHSPWKCFLLSPNRHLEHTEWFRTDHISCFCPGECRLYEFKLIPGRRDDSAVDDGFFSRKHLKAETRPK